MASIPDSLKTNAYSVLRFDDESIEISSIKSGKRTDSYAVTVLDEKGESDAIFKFNGDSFRELKSFSAKLYDANGILLKKYGKSDLMSSEYSSELASDNKITYFECKAPSIPFTIRYDYEVSLKNGILNYGYFAPIGTFYQSVQRYHYHVQLPESIKPRIKSLNKMPEAKVSTEKGVTTWVWNVANLKAVESEPLNPPLDELTPTVLLAPSEFVYDGVPGSISTWSDLGKWSFGLTNGRDLLPETVKAKIIDLTKNDKTDRDRVHTLYDYLGETTRYVSIQLGIGGYQPMSAMEVNKTGFGDCKALTNYLKSMLAFLNINSEYCTIRYDEKQKDLMSDFPNFTEMNHVILKVPLKEDTLWLECTNPRLPFGYVHDGIAGHEVLVCLKDGGVMERLPDYADSLNVEMHVANVNLATDGSANVNMYKDCRVKIYEDYFWFPRAKSSDQSDNLREDIHLPSVTLGSYKATEYKSANPNIKVDYNWSTPLYGSKTGNRLFLPVNIFRSGYDALRKNKRVLDLHIYKGFRDADSIRIHIPDSYEVENLPNLVEEFGRFGKFTSKVTIQGNVIQIVQIADIHSGKYKASDFPDFMAFLNKITAAYKSKIILRRKAI